MKALDVEYYRKQTSKETPLGEWSRYNFVLWVGQLNSLDH